MSEQVRILKESNPDAIVSVGAYAACAAFIRDARDAGLDVPIANVSFVDSERQLKLLLQAGQKKGVDYTKNLINSQVVPSFADTSLPAVKQYRAFMTKYSQMPPARLMDKGYTPHKYSPVSLEGFLNAKMIIEILRRLGPFPRRHNIGTVVENIHSFDLGIDVKVSFGEHRHQGLDAVYLTTVRNGRFVQIPDLRAWEMD
jgi:ABC-type branched-subunit amino acid transport system substrate-binding protein